MKDSYSENKLDFSSMVENLCFAEKLKFKIKRGKYYNQLNNYLLNGKLMRNNYNDMIKNLKKVAVEMQNLNQLNLFNIFSEDEISGNNIFDV